MIGWLVALALYALGVRSLYVASQEDSESDNISTTTRMYIILAWPIIELQDTLFPTNKEDGDE